MTPDKPSTPMPCPFCGSQPTVKLYNPHDDEPSCQILCENLGCQVRPHLNAGSQEETYAAWNRRPSPSSRAEAVNMEAIRKLPTY